MEQQRRETTLASRLRGLSAKRFEGDNQVKLLGVHPSFRKAQERLLRFSKIDRPVLIRGETGVGKESFARSLFLLSDRSSGPFISVNCAQFSSEETLVSQLFGHKAGSFTGATEDREGIFEQANGGVVFLDEVGELPTKAQALLLRVIGEGEVCPLGEGQPSHVDVRVITATNQDLSHMVRRGTFRKSLFFRVGYLRLDIPPLRERGDDWRIIFRDYLEDLNYEHDTDKSLTPEAIELLDGYTWPGNVRELLAIADVGFCMSQEEDITTEHFSHQLGILSEKTSVSANGEPAGQQFSPTDMDRQAMGEVSRREEIIKGLSKEDASQNGNAPNYREGRQPCEADDKTTKEASSQSRLDDKKSESSESCSPDRSENSLEVGDEKGELQVGSDSVSEASGPQLLDFKEHLERSGRGNGNRSVELEDRMLHSPDKIYKNMRKEEKDFWEAVRKPYLDRELNRQQVRRVVRRGLRASGGSYKRLLKIFNISEEKYTKFMDFLRNHRLKPSNDN